MPNRAPNAGKPTLLIAGGALARLTGFVQNESANGASKAYQSMLRRFGLSKRS